MYKRQVLVSARRTAKDKTGSSRESVRAGARALIDFALAHPALYEVMFFLPFDELERYPAHLYRRARAILDGIFIS